MIIIAFKGLIGSGKSTATEYVLNNYDAITYNCDKAVKKLYHENEIVIDKVNKEILNESNDYIDIKDLKEIVLNDNNKLEKLEYIVYPYLTRDIKELILQEAKYLVLDCQQIDKIYNDVDYFIQIDTHKESILSRVKTRDDRSFEETTKIINIQENLIIDNNKFTLSNNGTKEKLYNQIDQLLRMIDEDHR
ncbi:MAG: dephospho-CoA kinase [Mycoplasmatales bacterium]